MSFLPSHPCLACYGRAVRSSPSPIACAKRARIITSGILSSVKMLGATVTVARSFEFSVGHGPGRPCQNVARAPVGPWGRVGSPGRPSRRSRRRARGGHVHRLDGRQFFWYGPSCRASCPTISGSGRRIAVKGVGATVARAVIRVDEVEPARTVTVSRPQTPGLRRYRA